MGEQEHDRRGTKKEAFYQKKGVQGTLEKLTEELVRLCLCNSSSPSLVRPTVSAVRLQRAWLSKPIRASVAGLALHRWNCGKSSSLTSEHEGRRGGGGGVSEERESQTGVGVGGISKGC